MLDFVSYLRSLNSSSESRLQVNQGRRRPHLGFVNPQVVEQWELLRAGADLTRLNAQPRGSRPINVLCLVPKAGIFGVLGCRE